SANYDVDKIRGVNIGGWLVLEPWITPAIFEEVGDAAVDEWTLTEVLGKENAKDRLLKHWGSFVSQTDFDEIAAAGLTHVRIPVGYWAVIPLNDEPYVNGQLDFLDRAVFWAQSAGLQVIVDLHGAPGSQNGFDNSGRRGPVQWQQGDTVDRTTAAIQGLIDRYYEYPNVIFEALNEPSIPAGVDRDLLSQYYGDFEQRVHEVKPDATFVLHDGFNPVDSWNGFLSENNVVIDNHHYEVFDNSLLTKDVSTHVQNVCAHSSGQLQKSDKWAIVGEWTGAMTDCAKYLNGKGIGARYDGTMSADFSAGSCDGKSVGTVAEFSGEDKENTRRFIEGQLDAWEQKSGWVFWTWKTEGAPEWDMRQLLAEGVFPQPLDDRQFPGQCG
ncbi:glucan 1,3-beta-glucosidase, partial [Aspergillus glaucus CBS 516.65]